MNAHSPFTHLETEQGVAIMEVVDLEELSQDRVGGFWAESSIEMAFSSEMLETTGMQRIESAAWMARTEAAAISAAWSERFLARSDCTG